MRIAQRIVELPTRLRPKLVRRRAQWPTHHLQDFTAREVAQHRLQAVACASAHESDLREHRKKTETFITKDK